MDAMPPWLTTLLAEAKAYGPIVLIPVGAVVALVVLVLIWRSLRKQAPDNLAVKVAVALASAFSAQGMYEVATTKLHLPWYLAAGLFAVAEMAMLASAVRAHRHYEATSTGDQPGQLGPHARFVWLIAFAAGVIVSLNAHSPSEYFLRLFMPLLVAGLWRMGYVSPIAKKRAADAITMRWTPRRIGVALGIIEPGERDLATINADRQRRQMIAHAHAYHRGSLLLGWWHAARLRRLALDAGDDVIESVRLSVDRVHRVEDSTAPRRDTLRSDLPAWFRSAPWTLARRSAELIGALRAERAEAERMLSAERSNAEQEALRSADALRSAVEAERSKTAFETERFTALLRTEREARSADAESARIELATTVEQIRTEHAVAMAEQRSALTERINAERSVALRPQRSGAGRPTAPRSDPAHGGAERSNGAKLSDAEAIAVMLAEHPGADYDWRSTEVVKLTRAGFGRAPRLIDLIAEHHRRNSGASDSDDLERELAELTG